MKKKILFSLLAVFLWIVLIFSIKIALSKSDNELGIISMNDFYNRDKELKWSKIRIFGILRKSDSISDWVKKNPAKDSLFSISNYFDWGIDVFGDFDEADIGKIIIIYGKVVSYTWTGQCGDVWCEKKKIGIKMSSYELVIEKKWTSDDILNISSKKVIEKFGCDYFNHTRTYFLDREDNSYFFRIRYDHVWWNLTWIKDDEKKYYEIKIDARTWDITQEIDQIKDFMVCDNRKRENAKKWEEECTSIEDVPKREQCYLKTISTYTNSKICELFQIGANKDSCYIKLVTFKKDYYFCSQIDSSNQRGIRSCYYNVAYWAKNKELCSNFPLLYRNNCYTLIAAATKDKSICEEYIADSNDRDNCLQGVRNAVPGTWN